MLGIEASIGPYRLMIEVEQGRRLVPYSLAAPVCMKADRKYLDVEKNACVNEPLCIKCLGLKLSRRAIYDKQSICHLHNSSVILHCTKLKILSGTTAYIKAVFE